MPDPWNIVISCEHGGNRVPNGYLPLFREHEELLKTHRGYDIGILPLARLLAKELSVPFHAAEVTRLLVDLNRSRRSPTLFSEITRPLPVAQRESILRLYYDPYREGVTRSVAEAVEAGRALHLSIHSFTPVLHEEVRRADIGLLYDPGRPVEAKFCRRWKEAVARLDPSLRVRLNYPYRGVSDCLVSALRRRFGSERYVGLEIEINQNLPTGDANLWRHVQQVLLASFREAAQP